MKQQEFIEWINLNGFYSIINVTDRDSRGDFLDITANRAYELYQAHPEQSRKLLNEISCLKVSLLGDIGKEQLKFEEEYKKLNPFNWEYDLSKRPDGSYCGEIAFYAFKYWLIRAEIEHSSK